jgi:hypothetical protein
MSEEQALMFDASVNQKEDITAVAKKITDKPLYILNLTCTLIIWEGCTMASTTS